MKKDLLNRLQKRYDDLLIKRNKAIKSGALNKSLELSQKMITIQEIMLMIYEHY